MAFYEYFPFTFLCQNVHKSATDNTEQRGGKQNFQLIHSFTQISRWVNNNLCCGTDAIISTMLGWSFATASQLKAIGDIT